METKSEIIKSEHSASPDTLIQLAIQKDVDVSKLEKLMELRERWESNEARKLFLEAMSKFQSECPPLLKTKKVAFKDVRYNYAPLGEIAATITPKLRECSLSYRWEMNDTNGSIQCTCIVSHVAGHSEKTTMSANKDASGGKNEIQQRGSTITYLQRYTLIGALGISTADEDNDGQTQQNNGTPEVKAAASSAAPQAPVKAYSKGEDTRPWLNDKQYKQALERINAGNLDVYHKTVEQFRMKRDYRKVLDEAFNLSKSFIE